MHPITASQGVQLCFQKLNHGCPRLKRYDFANSLKFYRICNFRQSIPISTTTIQGRLVVVASKKRDSQDNIQKLCGPKSHYWPFRAVFPNHSKGSVIPAVTTEQKTKGPANNSHAHCIHSSPWRSAASSDHLSAVIIPNYDD